MGGRFLQISRTAFRVHGAGKQIQPRTAPETAQWKLATAIDEVSQPFTSPTVSSRQAVPPLASSRLDEALWGVWAFGFLGISGARWTRWRRIRDAVQAGRPLPLEIPIPAVSSRVLVEPAIFGIVRPVLFLPGGIFDRLTPATYLLRHPGGQADALANRLLSHLHDTLMRQNGV